MTEKMLTRTLSLNQNKDYTRGGGAIYWFVKSWDAVLLDDKKRRLECIQLIHRVAQSGEVV